ncbi:hypothetical protein POM88_006749 [Heracleum sosnowskyi]|uniref:3'-5' exonuclease domain-containing protein n=1 Tax=Heracleum sosnowskyi TaxID=360622 RepID=A0AAD8N5U4_9APIA|nr:hypothetical protein POM88_006749 [Heracleum sosnowskyi]
MQFRGEALIIACKPALESVNITKVIHDCKRDSEALYFQFGIKLHNVVDTQIAYSLIEEQEGRTKAPNDYISFVGLLADPRYCGTRFSIHAIERMQKAKPNEPPTPISDADIYVKIRKIDEAREYKLPTDVVTKKIVSF